MAAEVVGAKEAMRELRKLEPAIARASVKFIKQEAEPLRARVAGIAPRPILAHMPSDAPKVITRYGGRSNKQSVTILVRIVVKGPKWVVAAAGANKDRVEGGTFARNLRARYGAGTPTRWFWGVVKAAEGTLVKQIEAAVWEIERTYNRELKG